MFKNAYQSGFLSILFAGGSKPLGIWGEEVRNGHIRRVTDEDVQTLALELMGTNVATTYIICPPGKKDTLGIKLPFFIMIVKNMKKYFTFEITVLGSSYIETLRVQIHANVRIRRIYFSDRLYAEDEMPQEFKLYVPISSKKDKGSKGAPMEDKSTGADKVRVSAAAEAKPEEAAKEEEPSGAPPSPTDTVREEAPPAPAEVKEEVAESATSEAGAPSEAGVPEETEAVGEETPAEEGAEASEAPGEETPAEEGPVPSEAAGEETPAEEGPEPSEAAGEETPAEEAPAEEAPAEEALAEEAPAEEAPAEEAPAE